MTVFARRSETILVWASQDIVKGPVKFRTLGRCANSIGPIKYRIDIRFLSIHDVNLKRYCGNFVPITACLLGIGLTHSQYQVIPPMTVFARR